ncbi:MAG: ABC transporter permease [Chitinophagaceae bacterium]
MLINYLKIAWRSLVKNNVSSLINIGGLAVGMAVVILISLWIYDELSFNKNFKNYNHIAQVMQNQTFNGEVQTWTSQAMQLAPELRDNYGDNFKHVIMAGWTNGHLLSIGEKKLVQNGNYMEPAITEMLSLHMLKGSRAGLKDPGSILLSKSTARAIFGNDEPLDKLLKIDNKLDVRVTGVYEDLPANSSFGDLKFIAPWQLMVNSDELVKKVTWGNSWFQTIVQIADNADMAQVSAKIKNAKLNRIKNSDDMGARFKPELFLHPMSRWHLFAEFKNGFSSGGRIQHVWLFGIIGFFVLLLACINFMNLSTARSEKRAKEVGIRKTVGSLRRQLISQFFTESILVSFFAFVVSLALVLLMLPFFNEVAGKKMSVLWSNPVFWLAGIGFTLFTGLIAGSYPALYLSSFKPIKVLKGTFKAGRFASTPRKILVITQFTVSVTLIICSIIVFRQIQFAKNRPVGYSTNGLVSVPIKTDEILKHYDAFRNDLLQTGLVEELTATDSPITNTYVTNSGFDWQGKDPNMQEEFITLRVTHEFGKTMGWKIIEGRDFSKSFATDSSAFILNEAAVKYMGLKDPIGKIIKWGGSDNYKVIGVIKDLVTQSPYEPSKQTIFFLNYKRLGLVTMKINPLKNAHEALARIESVFKIYDPVNPFEYKFVDEEFAKKFGNEERIGKLAGFFAILAIFISCLGLFGLASFIAEQRTKEIGLRKVLGASVFNLWRLLSREFVFLVVISLFIAAPIAWYFMSSWLQNYQYRSNISWWIFAVAGAGALVITLLTVSFQTIKAAIANPVKSLRSE